MVFELPLCCFEDTIRAICMLIKKIQIDSILLFSSYPASTASHTLSGEHKHAASKCSHSCMCWSFPQKNKSADCIIIVIRQLLVDLWYLAHTSEVLIYFLFSYLYFIFNWQIYCGLAMFFDGGKKNINLRGGTKKEDRQAYLDRVERERQEREKIRIRTKASLLLQSTYRAYHARIIRKNIER